MLCNCGVSLRAAPGGIRCVESLFCYPSPIAIRKLQKSVPQIIDSIFWVLLAVLLIVVAAFPHLVFWVTGIFGFDSSSNFVFFCGILVLLARLFTQNLKVATLKRKLTTLTQTDALKEHGR